MGVGDVGVGDFGDETIRSTPMLSVQGSVNQMLPSGPLVIASGCGPLAPGTVGTVVDTGKSVTTPAVVIWPMSPACSVKYRFLSEPTVMSGARLAAAGGILLEDRARCRHHIDRVRAVCREPEVAVGAADDSGQGRRWTEEDTR